MTRLASTHPAARSRTATLRQLLTHTSGPPNNLVFAYRPDRLDPLQFAVQACTGSSFRETLANQLDRLAMVDSVPGPDVIHLAPAADGFPDSLGGRAIHERARTARDPVCRHLGVPLLRDDVDAGERSDFHRCLTSRSSSWRSGRACSCAPTPSRSPGARHSIETASRCRTVSAGSCRATTARRLSGSSAPVKTAHRRWR